MANYADLLSTIDANIYANGNEEITGPVLNAVLHDMVDRLIAESIIHLVPVSFTLRNYWMNSSGIFGSSTGYKHFIVPVNGADMVEVVAQAGGNAAQVAFFTSDNVPVANQPAKQVPGTVGYVTVTELQGRTRLTIPKGTEFIYFYAGASGTYPARPDEINLIYLRTNYNGVADTTEIPDPNDGDFWIAKPGTYANLGGIIVDDDEIAVIRYVGGDWIKEDTGIAPNMVNELLGRVDKVTTNLFDPSKITQGYYIDNQARTIATMGYSDYIPVEPGETYTLQGVTSNNGTGAVRYVTYFDIDKKYKSYVSSQTSVTIPADVYWMVCSVYTGTALNPGSFDPTRNGVFKGAAQPFEKFYAPKGQVIYEDSFSYADKDPRTIMTKQDMADAIAAAEGTPPIKVIFTDPGITIQGPNSYEIGASLDRHYLPQFAYSSNHVFNFDSYAFGSMTPGSGSNDDVAPSHFQHTTLGANHAQPTQIGTVTGHGLDNTAIGTAWTKSGKTFYIVRIVDEDNIEFLSANDGTDTDHSFTALTTGTLDDGNGNTLTVTAISSSQLWPCVKNKAQRIMLDGKTQVTAAGTYRCHFLDIVESYDFCNTADVLRNIIARVGTPDDPVYTGDTMFTYENIYRFLPNGATLVMVSITAVQQMPLQDIMFNQAARFGNNGAIDYYVPNSLPVNGYDFRTPQTMTWSSSLPLFNFTADTWADADNPPNRVVQIRHASGYGFALGFLPVGVGKSLKDYTSNAFELRNNTGKVYPHGVHSGKVGTTIAAGMAYNAVMYRVYFAPQPAHRIAFYSVEFDGAVYAYADYKASASERLEIDTALNGKTVTLIEARNCTLLTDVYNDGYRVKADYQANDTCFIVVKIQ